MRCAWLDGGREFDWGKTSADYARYRDVYPKEFYDKVVGRKLCVKDQRVLDLGTGTGVLPRNLYSYGAAWTGVDSSREQIEQAKRLSEGMDITYLVSPAEQADAPDGSLDVVTACQCFWYFDHKMLAPRLARMLKPQGRLLLLVMAWLPWEDEIAGKSEALVLKYHPAWSGAGETLHPIFIPKEIYEFFELVYHEEYRIFVPFTRETWHGRMKACRGVGAALSKEELAAWEKEHWSLLGEIAPEHFEVLHYGALAELKKKEA